MIYTSDLSKWCPCLVKNLFFTISLTWLKPYSSSDSSNWLIRFVKSCSLINPEWTLKTSRKASLKRIFLFFSTKGSCSSPHIPNPMAFWIINESSADPPHSGLKEESIPLLLDNVLTRNNLNNHLLIVVRYFGGTKLGVGPLLRSYTKVANDVIK